MSRPNVYGHVTVRPVRVAFLDSFDSVDRVVAAATVAADRWGGHNYLLLPEPLTERSIEFASNIGVDVMAAVPGLDRGPVQVPPTFEFQAFPNKDPFDKSDGSLRRDVLAMQTLTRAASWEAGPASPSNVCWRAAHPLAPLLSLLVGDVASPAPNDVQRPNVADLGRGAPVPSDADDEGRLRQTLAGLTRPHRADYRGIVCLDVTSPSDLVGFWNVRATGADVVAYVPQHHDLICDYVAAWLATQVSLDQEGIRVWSSTNAFPLGLRELLLPHGARWFMEELAPVPPWAYVLPIESHFSQNFDVVLDPGDWSFDVPLPRMDLLPPAPWHERFGTVSAEVIVTGERDLPTGRSTSAPASRDVGAKLLQEWSSPGLAAFLRPSTDGSVIAVDAREARVQVPLIGSMRLFSTLFEAAGLELKRSDAGLYCEQIIEMFGGVHPDGVALHPAVREVLYRAAQSPFGSPVQALITFAKQKQGDWPTSMFGRNRDYPAWVIHWLSDHNFLHARLKTKCPNCGNGLSIAPSDLSDDLVCPLCNQGRPLSLHLSALKPQWRLALHRHLQADRLAETMPVLGALSLLASTQGYSGLPLHHGVGVRVSGDIDCELDLVVATREREAPIVVIGECKSFRDAITPTDVANLTAVQQRLAAVGIECYVLYATLKETFRTEEVQAIRESARELGSTASFRKWHPVQPIAPIALDGRSLSTHSFSKDSLLRSEPGPRTLASLAIGSCKRNLGLTAVQGLSQGPDRYVTTWG